MKLFFCITLGISVFLFVFAILRFCFGRNFLLKRVYESDNKAGLSKALRFSGCLLLSIFLMRYAMALCIQPEEGAPVLNGIERFVESFFRSLRTFGIEEEYPRLVVQMKSLIVNKFWRFIAVLYASILEIIAPIAGGAIILEILSNIWPRIRLYLSFLQFGKRKYCYFSELNAPSVALAKSIVSEYVKKKNKPQPVLIFADAYVDREDEREYELFLKAKQLDAICVRDDLAHIPKPFSLRKNREFYLMDENEFGNLQALASLVDPENVKYIKSALIYMFVQSDAYVRVEKNIQKEFGKLFANPSEKPRIIPVRGYRNLVQNLLQEVPLYEPLISNREKKELSVTILGNGLIGTEAFLNVYWMGQMLLPNEGMSLEPCHLTVNVVSKDDEETFWSKIDYVNPEIQKTVHKINSNNSPNPLLVYNRESKKTMPPYCNVRYVKADLKIDGFWDGEIEDIGGILRSDYFIVALGSDADNISIAEKIRAYIGKKHIEEHQKNAFNRAVITYAVFDSELAKTLNEERRFKSVSERAGDCDIYTYAFGSLEDVYSCKNVYLSKYSIWEAVCGKDFGDTRHNHLQDNDVRIGEKLEDYEKSNYDYWANLARALHIKYKVFSLGWIKNSVFSDANKEEYDLLQTENFEKYGLYLKLTAVSASGRFDWLEICDRKYYCDLQKKREYLAWLEHRRWNAFTRTMGYRHVDIQKLLEGVKAQKDMRLRLHACLVETEFPCASQHKGCYMWMENGKFDTYDTALLDSLDLVSKAKAGGDYKEYDYPSYDLNVNDREKVLRNLQLLKKDTDKSKKIRVLFVGNSYTYYNDMPQTFFTECAKASGYEIEVTSVTRGGHRLAQFADGQYEEGIRLRQTIARKHYDVAILQEQSLTPIKDEEGFLKGTEDVAKLISADRFILYATWGRNDGHPALEELGLTRHEMTEKLSRAYRKAAKRIDAEVAEVGFAFLDYSEKLDRNDLYNPDKSHPSAIGSKLAAEVIWERVKSL